MAIPEFNEFGLLPVGVHQATPGEVEGRYCGNPNRREIWRLFLHFYRTELMPLNWSSTMFIDGGFTSDKSVTKDVDVILDVSHLQPVDLLLAANWHGTNHDRVEIQYKTDFWLYHPLLPNDLRTFFCYIKEHERLARGAPLGATKGLLRLEL